MATFTSVSLEHTDPAPYVSITEAPAPSAHVYVDGASIWSRSPAALRALAKALETAAEKLDVAKAVAEPVADFACSQDGKITTAPAVRS